MKQRHQRGGNLVAGESYIQMSATGAALPPAGVARRAVRPEYRQCAVDASISTRLLNGGAETPVQARLNIVSVDKRHSALHVASVVFVMTFLPLLAGSRRFRQRWAQAACARQQLSLTAMAIDFVIQSLLFDNNTYFATR